MGSPDQHHLATTPKPMFNTIWCKEASFAEIMWLLWVWNKLLTTDLKQNILINILKLHVAVFQKRPSLFIIVMSWQLSEGLAW